MRQYQATPNRRTYSELVCVLPTGLTTLYRGTSYADVKHYREEKHLSTYKGKKVSLVERSSEEREQTGWLLKEIKEKHLAS